MVLGWEYAPVCSADLVDFAVDQISPSGMFTRLAPTVGFSRTPSFAARPTNLPGTSPDTAGWSSVVPSDDPLQVPH